MKLHKKAREILQKLVDTPKLEIVLLPGKTGKADRATLETKEGVVVKVINTRTWANLYWGRYVDPNGKIFGQHFYKISLKGEEALKQSP